MDPDVSQAYLQSRNLLFRDVYVKPKGSIKLKEGHLLNLIETLYELIDRGNYWHNTVAYHLKGDLLMKPITGDLPCFSKTTNGKLGGMTSTNGGDCIGTEHEQFIEKSKLTARRFESKARLFDNITFAGISIDKKEKGYFTHQRLYTSRLKETTLNCIFELFRERRHALAWTTHT